MKALNTFEKEAVLGSVCNMVSLSFFALIKNINRNMKNVIFIICVVIFFSSCSGTKFLKRKYTTGMFFENKNFPVQPKVSNLNRQIVLDSNEVLSNKSNSVQVDSIQLTTKNIEDTCKNVDSAVVNKKQYYSNIIMHNTIYADTNQQYCSTKNEIKITKSQNFSKNIKTHKSIFKKNKQYSDESFWTYLFSNLGKTFFEALLIAGIVVFIVWLAYTFFAPTTLFWLMLIGTLTVVAITTYLVKLIKEKPKSPGNKSEVFDKIIAGLGQGALMVFELAFSIILSA